MSSVRDAGIVVGSSSQMARRTLNLEMRVEKNGAKFCSIMLSRVGLVVDRLKNEPAGPEPERCK